MQLPILYQDEAIVAVHKPAGLLVHRSLIDNHETRFAMQIVRDQIGQHVFTVHRLDKPTSGVLLFALTADIARQLGEQFEANDITKFYIAIVRGYTNEQGHIDHPLKEKLDKIADRMAISNKPAKEAETHYLRLATFELNHPVGRYNTARYSLMRLTPQTGRKHQLRRHLAHISHPILGDTTHGDGKHNQFIREHFGFHGLALTANMMRLTHPVTQDEIIIQSQTDDRIVRLLSMWEYPKEEIRKIWSEL